MRGTKGKQTLMLAAFRLLADITGKALASRQQGCIWCPSQEVITLQLHALNLTPRAPSPLADLQPSSSSPPSALLLSLSFLQCASSSSSFLVVSFSSDPPHSALTPLSPSPPTPLPTQPSNAKGAVIPFFFYINIWTCGLTLMIKLDIKILCCVSLLLFQTSDGSLRDILYNCL